MNQLSVNHLLGIKYLTAEDIELIFTTADQFKEVINRPIKKVPSQGISLLPICFLRIVPVHAYPLSWLKSVFLPM